MANYALGLLHVELVFLELAEDESEVLQVLELGGAKNQNDIKKPRQNAGGTSPIPHS
jgi:hypothetical protein